MDAFRKIAEDRIRAAMDRGEFDNLPNSGKPLKIEEDVSVPEDLRLAYRVLKNAGCLPPELELRKESVSLRELIDTIDDDKERLRKVRRLNFSLLKLNTIRERPFHINDIPEYEEPLLRRLVD